MKDAQDTQKEKKLLSKKDKTLLLVAGIALAIALCCQGWFYWPWFGGNVIHQSRYKWDSFATNERTPNVEEIPYIENTSPYTKQQVIHFFKEIVLRTEYDTSANECHKWAVPVQLYIAGEYSQEDLDVIEMLCDGLNRLPGHPGISIVTEESIANIFLQFQDETLFRKGLFGQFNIDSFDDNGNITLVKIRINNGLSRQMKTAVICEELIQSMGPMNDTTQTEDSLFNASHWNLLQPTELDWTLLRMLYHPSIQSGMDYLHCFPFFWEYLK